MGSTIGNTLEKITSYKNYISSKVLEQYKGKENWDKILNLITKPFDEIENVIFDLYLKRWIASSEGKQLDNIGYNLSVNRDGLSDDGFRQVIYGFIGQYNSNGTIEDIIRIANLMTNSGLVSVNELFPAKMIVTVIGDSLLINEDFFKTTLKKATSGGVGIDVLAVHGTPVFVYGSETGAILPTAFIGYPSEDGSNESYYAESL